jgi:hypothetical protein
MERGGLKEDETMSDVTVSRKQRLRTLENQIREAAENIQTSGLAIGRWLCEIRDEELWKDEHASWNEYLKVCADELVGKTFSQSALFIRAAEISERIPAGISSDVRTNLTASHLNELGRLVPTVGKDDERGAEKDYSRLRKQDVARVLKAAAEFAEGETVSVRDIRRAVDEELGVDRSKQAKDTKQQREKEDEERQQEQEEAATPERRLEDLLWELKQYTEGLRAMVAEIGTAEWKRWKANNQILIKRLIAGWGAFADMLRSE